MGKQHGGSSAKAGGAHRWAVDRIEEGTAAVEQDGDHVYEIPRWLLPPNVREGDVLNASLVTSGEGFLTISVRLDRAASDAANTPRSKRTRSPGDPGGDIVL